MSLLLTPLDRAKTYERVVRRIKDEVFAGRLRPGDRLPGERQLSEQLNVSRPAVREAVRILQAMGIIQASPGTGARAGLIISATPSRALSDLLGVHVALSNYSVPEVMEVRLALECQAVRSVAGAGVELSEEMEPILAQMAEPEIDREVFHDLDTEFHLALARATGNVLLVDLMLAMREAVRRPMSTAFAGEPDWEGRRSGLISEHRAIFEAVRARDAAKAERLTREHIEGFYETLQEASGR
ncbi:FadR/GntR family transcriptional regulator [uncultured Aeromicrobium sp.]|uniref:FadR/GntR family transcriptional regulator n=1 Tax=uncultured Aeromicrobium sp. TaxID=337820 RepID=UPI0025E4CC59|nr:FadR/GntR family transcriptional regulator [uncultured Aeromicrobium sp.]